MSAPIRIQRKRVKGWRMPANTVCVTRPGKWGNPFFVAREDGEWVVISCLPKDLEYDKHPIVVWKCDTRPESVTKAVELFREALALGDLGYERYDVEAQLRGKNLACFCPIGSPCHADVLIEIANGGAK